MVHKVVSSQAVRGAGAALGGGVGADLVMLSGGRCNKAPLLVALPMACISKITCLVERYHDPTSACQSSLRSEFYLGTCLMIGYFPLRV